jgi:molecular chaperone GrpE
VTDRPAEPTPGPEAYDLPEGEPTAAPSPEGFGDAAGEAPAQPFDTARPSPTQEPTEVEGQQDDLDVDTEEDELAAMKGSLADLTNDLQRLQAEYANYRKRVDRDRQLVAETAAYKALTPVVEVLDTIDRAKEHGELDGGFKAVADQLERVVAAAGLARFGEPGDAFDPNLHEALSHLGTDPEVEVTTVKHVAKGGYRMGDRVVRAAQVLVVDPADG